MKYKAATETITWKYIPIVVKTNCTDKKNGHIFEWVKKEEANKIRKTHPRMTLSIVKCITCGKIKQTM